MAKRKVLSPDAKITLSVLDIRIFRAIELLVRAAIDYSGNHVQVRTAAIALTHAMKAVAEELHHHDTPDVLSLLSMLRRADPRFAEVGGRPPEAIPLTLMEARRQLTPEQISAARMVLLVWRAFGRLLTVVARSYDGTAGGKRNRVLQPVEVMGEDLYDQWRQYYVPWYNKANVLMIKDLSGFPCTTRARLVINVVVEDKFPATLDKGLKLKRGTVAEILREELTNLADLVQRGKPKTFHGDKEEAEDEEAQS